MMFDIHGDHFNFLLSSSDATRLSPKLFFVIHTRHVLLILFLVHLLYISLHCGHDPFGDA